MGWPWPNAGQIKDPTPLLKCPVSRILKCVENAFNPTFEVHNIENGVFQNAPFANTPFANGSFPNGDYSCLWAEGF